MSDFKPWPETKPPYRSGFWLVKYADGTTGLCELIGGKWQTDKKVIAYRLMVEGFNKVIPKCNN